MRKRIAVYLFGLTFVAVGGIAPAQATIAVPAYDTNWPCHGC